MTPVAPRVAERWGPHVPMAVGQFLMAGGLLALSIAAATASSGLLSGLTLLVGLGASLTIPTMTALLVDSVPPTLVGTASGLLNTARQLGGALAFAVFGALIAQRPTFLDGLQTSLLIAVLFMTATASLSLTLRSGRPSFLPPAHQR